MVPKQRSQTDPHENVKMVTLDSTFLIGQVFRDELVHDKNNDANAVSLEHIIFECHIITDPKHVLEIAFWLENARYKR